MPASGNQPRPGDFSHAQLERLLDGLAMLHALREMVEELAKEALRSVLYGVLTTEKLFYAIHAHDAFRRATDGTHD